MSRSDGNKVDQYPPDEEAPYWAGLFDGEGCVQIRKSNGLCRSINVTLGQKGSLIPNLMKAKFGGRVCSYKCKQFFAWTTAGGIAERFLKWICPHSILKRPQIELALAYYRDQIKGRCFNVYRPLSTEEREQRDRSHQKLRLLKQESYGA